MPHWQCMGKNEVQNLSCFVVVSTLITPYLDRLIKRVIVSRLHEIVHVYRCAPGASLSLAACKYAATCSPVSSAWAMLEIFMEGRSPNHCRSESGIGPLKTLCRFFVLGCLFIHLHTTVNGIVT